MHVYSTASTAASIVDTRKRQVPEAHPELSRALKRESIDEAGVAVFQTARCVLQDFSDQLYERYQRCASFNRVFAVKSYSPNLLQGRLRLEIVPFQTHKIALNILAGPRARIVNPRSVFEAFPKNTGLAIWYRAALKTLVNETAVDISLDDRIMLHRVLGHFSFYIQLCAYECFASSGLEGLC
jgi:hypothetical protein